tara:strand:+ start:4396 stop:5085 length:690 start_codon:yes stop_codon:yes gene_type:complete
VVGFDSLAGSNINKLFQGETKMAINTKPFAVKGMNVVTPKGKALWCKITEADRKYNEFGEYSTSVVVDPQDPAVMAFIGKLEQLRDVALAETKETLGAKGAMYKTRNVVTDEFDQDGQPTGNVIIKVKMKDVDKRTSAGQQDRIAVVDAKKEAVTPVPLVGNGSIIRCAAYANPYTMANTKEVGVSLIWTKMQLIELVSFSQGGDDFDEEDGFAADAAPAAPVNEETDF